MIVVEFYLMMYYLTIENLVVKAVEFKAINVLM